MEKVGLDRRLSTSPTEQVTARVTPMTPKVAQRQAFGQAMQMKRDAEMAGFFPSGLPQRQNTLQRKPESHPQGLPTTVQPKMEAALNTDLSTVRVHTNSAEAKQLGAQAFTQGEHVHFAPGKFDPESQQGQELIGHEMAHVKQQREGRVQTTRQMKGMGLNDDKGLEREADEMGKKAARGEAMQGGELLRKSETSKGADQTQVAQLKTEKTHYGEFTDVYFEDIVSKGTTIGADIFLKFHPTDPVDASKIALVQSVRNVVDGKDIAVDVTKQQQSVVGGSGNGFSIDQLSQFRNPLYASGSEPTDAVKKDKMEEYDTPLPVRELTKKEVDDNKTAGSTGKKYDGWGEHGSRIKKNNAWEEKDATLHDSPTLPTKKPNSKKVFETAAVAIDGNQKGTYYGSVTWGLETDATGKLNKVAMAKGSDGVPTQKYMAAAKLWNDGTARGTLVAKADDVVVYDGALKEKFKLKKDDVIIQNREVMAGDIVYLDIKVDAANATHGGKTGYIKMSDVLDKQDGKATLDLPYAEVYETTADITDKLPKGSVAKPLMIPKGTRVQLVTAPTAASDGTIKVVDGIFTGQSLTIENQTMASSIQKEK